MIIIRQEKLEQVATPKQPHLNRRPQLNTHAYQSIFERFFHGFCRSGFCLLANASGEKKVNLKCLHMIFVIQK